MPRPRLALLAVALGFIACLGPKATSTMRAVPRPAQPRGAAIAVDPRLLRFELSEASPAVAEPRAPLAQGSALDAQGAAAVLVRLPPLPDLADSARTFALPARSLPPPQSGITSISPFPPAPPTRAAPPRVVSAPPEVTRHAPDGEVPVAAHVAVSFSEPMTLITSHAALEAQAARVSLTPELPGRWRWVGTQTLLFDPGTGRLPMATEYTVEVPAGTRSAAGLGLASAVRWTFATPPAKVQQFHPQDGTVRPDTLMFAEFDQRIDPAAVLGSIAVAAAPPKIARGATPASRQPAAGVAAAVEPGAGLRLATAAEIAADEHVRALVESSEQSGLHGRHLVFRAAQLLPPDSEIDVRVGPGTPSAEGPRKSTQAQHFGFRTFGPLRITGSGCGGEPRCEPLATWFVQTSNPIDTATFDRAMVKVTPELPAMQVEAAYSSLQITGRARAKTTYQVSFSPELADVFGQRLGQAAPVEFRVGRARPLLITQNQPMVVLEPAAGARFSVFSINQPSLRVRVHAVQPEDWDAYLKSMRDDARADRARVPPGEKRIDTHVQVTGEPDALNETRIDLSPALGSAGLGHVILQVDGTAPVPKDQPWARQRLHTWVQVTQIGLSAFADDEALLGWATSLKDGAALRDVALSLWPAGQSARTGADGLASLALRDSPGRVLIAQRGEDRAFLPQSSAYWYAEGGWSRSQPQDQLVWYVADDRHLYRPGETLRFKGWLRTLGGGKRGEIGLPRGAVEKVAWSWFDSRGNPLGKGESALTGMGGFDGRLELPGNMNLGSARLEFQPIGAFAGQGTSLQFEVQEFRRPEFEVTTQASDGPHLIAGAATLTASARYYAGGPLSQADTHWQLTATAASFTPPNRQDFTFGIWKPWWLLERPMIAARGFAKIGFPGPRAQDSVTQSFDGRTDANGLHRLRVDLLGANPPQPIHVRADASVRDVNRQEWTGSSELLVHPAAHYVGLRSERYFVQSGEALPVDAIVVDLDGKAQPGRAIQLSAARLQWAQVKGESQEQEVDAEQCDVQSAAKAVRCVFHPKQPGQYRVSARIYDDKGRANLTQMVRWVAGEATAPDREVRNETVTLIPSQSAFDPAEDAELLVIAPFFPAEGTLSLRRAGIVKTQRFRMEAGSRVLRVPLEEAYAPKVTLHVDLVGSAPRVGDAGEPDARLPRRPAYASGELTLQLPPRSRTLRVAVKPQAAALAPGAATHIDVTVHDAGGKPAAGADLALAVVDEAVLALSDYRFPDPIGVFYFPRESGTQDTELRQHVVLASPGDAARAAAPGGGIVVTGNNIAPMKSARAGRVAQQRGEMLMADSEAANVARAPIALRSDFSALAAFSPSVMTDAAGHARVAIELPDNLTRYRVMVIAAHGEQRFGSGEAAITARLPLMVRPSAPRFLNFGDRFELPVVVQNQTQAPLEVDLAVRASNAEPRKAIGRRVRVPANARVEVRFPAAARQPGTARFQLAGVSGALADAAEFSLPVWTPATSEAFASYGVIDAGAIAQKIAAPPDVWPEFGGLELTTSSTALQALTDAVLYLVDYPFDCAEQMASRMLALGALKDVLGAFEAKGLPPPEQLLASIGRDLDALRKQQNEDGGFGFWRRGERSSPYLSIHVAHALARLQQKRFAVPAEMLAPLHAYLKAIDSHITGKYAPDVRDTLVAYALYTRKQLGDADPARARALLAERGGPAKLNLEALGFVYPVLAAAAAQGGIRKEIQNRVEETAGAAHFTTTYTDGAHLLLHSDRRADALLLEGLIADQPKSDLIPKLVAGLLAQRRAGHWESTQENAFVLLALDRYFARYESSTPDFVARAWLGARFAAEQRFRNRSTEQHRLEVPMSYLLRGAASDLVLDKNGPGRLYYRIGMQYAPRDLAPKPTDRGFTVERVYEPIDAPGDVERDPDGTWRIRAGARVRVRVSMVAEARRYHVALTDPLPAGLEPQNPADGPRPLARGSWWGPWYEHESLRDQRAEVFTSALWEGVHEYVYIARATTPGSFVVPPPKAEEMYHPETFGRGAGDRVVIAE
jgi:alpha-2-macroglobulin